MVQGSMTVAAVVAAGAACLAVVVLLRRERASAPAGLAAAAVSLATTGIALVGSDPLDPNGVLGLLEVAALLVLIAVTVRRATTVFDWVTVGLLVVAQASWVLRYVPTRTAPALVGAAAAWGIGAVVALAAGAYPRFVDRREQLRVANARAAQRRQLERDLHDYVAHDLSGIIVQAQAAQYAAGDDPERLRAALERIEAAGHRAMASMDQALDLLRDASPLAGSDSLAGHPTLKQAPGIVRAFRDSSHARVDCEFSEAWSASHRSCRSPCSACSSSC